MKTSRENLDRAVKLVTAFRSYNDILESIESRRYVPTLRPTNFTASTEPELVEAVELIRWNLINDGHKVYPDAGAYDSDGLDNVDIAAIELRRLGATLEVKEDDFGETRDGWWMDNVWLGSPSRPMDALSCLRG